MVEGVMGLYDGKRGEPFGAYSSASVAKRLGLPVVLVLNARKAGPTLATQVLGLQRADPRVRIAGVILNQAASVKTMELLAPVIRRLCGIPVLGWLPRLPALALARTPLGADGAHASWRSGRRPWKASLGGGGEERRFRRYLEAAIKLMPRRRQRQPSASKQGAPLSPGGRTKTGLLSLLLSREPGLQKRASAPSSAFSAPSRPRACLGAPKDCPRGGGFPWRRARREPSAAARRRRRPSPPACPPGPSAAA